MLVKAAADGHAAAAALLAKLDSTERSDSSSDDEEGQDLCNCEFSLAYGAQPAGTA